MIALDLAILGHRGKIKKIHPLNLPNLQNVQYMHMIQ